MSDMKKQLLHFLTGLPRPIAVHIAKDLAEVARIISSDLCERIVLEGTCGEGITPDLSEKPWLAGHRRRLNE